ncbi:leucine-rich_repeat domain-containing protein [Hexamita inflata]|uniref:Partial n=1 Tax=Hexamita inflata TaxID=28002 RepID=A0AA86V9Z8_9EUKA|nr:leucine-rich repeat domain-containing protein [Hexamita inflata]
MQFKPHHEITSKEDLLNHFSSSQKLEICDLKQIEDLLEMNIPPEIWKDASNRNLLSFNLEFVQRTNKFTLTYNNIQQIDLLSFLTNLTELNLQNNKISDISAISKIKNLKKLQLRSNRIKDISALQSLPDLTHLNLSENILTTYTIALPNILYLNISLQFIDKNYCNINKLQDISGYNILLNQSVQICGEQKPQIQVLFLIRCSV